MKMNLRKLFFLLTIAVFLSASASAQTNKYIGASKCKMCHNKADKGEQFTKWENSPHAKAMESLKGDDASNPKCLKCHSTAAAIDASLNGGIKVEEGVSCESCHGPGSNYKTTTIMKNLTLAQSKGLVMPDEKVCKTCHNEESPNYKGFNYAEYVAKIAHDDPTTN